MLAPSPNPPDWLPKPQGFHPAGSVVNASRVVMPRRRAPLERTKKYKRGLQYEKKAVTYLKNEFLDKGTFLTEPCFRFTTATRSRFCYPDAVILLANTPFNLLIEIKTRHTHDAWWQLTQLYHPVVQKALGCELRLLEVVKAYDPGVRLPESEVKILENVLDAVDSNARYNLYIYTGR